MLSITIFPLIIFKLWWAFSSTSDFFSILGLFYRFGRPVFLIEHSWPTVVMLETWRLDFGREWILISLSSEFLNLFEEREERLGFFSTKGSARLWGVSGSCYRAAITSTSRLDSLSLEGFRIRPPPQKLSSLFCFDISILIMFPNFKEEDLWLN